MNAVIKEIKDANGKVALAGVWVVVEPHNSSEMNVARLKLDNYISNYIGNRTHNIYIHSEKDTVAAIMIFDIDKYPEQIFEI
jgi:hypothetical protein